MVALRLLSAVWLLAAQDLQRFAVELIIRAGGGICVICVMGLIPRTRAPAEGLICRHQRPHFASRRSPFASPLQRYEALVDTVRAFQLNQEGRHCE